MSETPIIRVTDNYSPIKIKGKLPELTIVLWLFRRDLTDEIFFEFKVFFGKRLEMNGQPIKALTFEKSLQGTELENFLKDPQTLQSIHACDAEIPVIANRPTNQFSLKNYYINAGKLVIYANFEGAYKRREPIIISDADGEFTEVIQPRKALVQTVGLACLKEASIGNDVKNEFYAQVLEDVLEELNQ